MPSTAFVRGSSSRRCSACLVAALLFAALSSCSSPSQLRVPPPPPNAAKRPPPPPLAKDDRPIDHALFTQSLNPSHPTHGTIHASQDGGCHVYVRDGKQHPPGWFPPPTPIECTEELLAPEWGNCTNAGMISATASRDECLCQPGDGDPPAPSFRIPCPH